MTTDYDWEEISSKIIASLIKMSHLVNVLYIIFIGLNYILGIRFYWKYLNTIFSVSLSHSQSTSGIPSKKSCNELPISEYSEILLFCMAYISK